MNIKKSLNKKHSDECTIDELKQKRKDARKSAWMCGLIGYGIMCLAIPVYLISFLVGVTVLILAFGLVLFLVGIGWKQNESDCTTRIMIKQILDGDIKK